MEILKILLSPIITLILFMVASFFWHRQKGRESKLQQEQYVKQKKVNALMAVWGLLRFLGQDSNVDAAFIEQGRKTERRRKILRVQQGKDFVNAVQKVFFEEGHGLYLSGEIKQNLFYCRTATFSMLQAEGRYNSETYQETNREDFIIPKSTKYKEELYGKKYEELSRFLKLELEELIEN